MGKSLSIRVAQIGATISMIEAVGALLLSGMSLDEVRRAAILAN